MATTGNLKSYFGTDNTLGRVAPWANQSKEVKFIPSLELDSLFQSWSIYFSFIQVDTSYFLIFIYMQAGWPEGPRILLCLPW